MKTFCNEMKLKIVQCIVCLEAWPIKETKAVSKFYYMRCVKDKIIPHSLHRVPYQIHIKKLAKIACFEAYFTECFDKDRRKFKYSKIFRKLMIKGPFSKALPLKLY